jgi:hypothetical protein
VNILCELRFELLNELVGEGEFEDMLSKSPAQTVAVKIKLTGMFKGRKKTGSFETAA